MNELRKLKRGISTKRGGDHLVLQHSKTSLGFHLDFIFTDMVFQFLMVILPWKIRVGLINILTIFPFCSESACAKMFGCLPAYNSKVSHKLIEVTVRLQAQFRLMNGRSNSDIGLHHCWRPW